MRLIGKDKLVKFGEDHADAKRALSALAAELENAVFRTPHDVKGRYPKAKVINGSTVVFRIRQNKYRVSILVHYATGTMVVIAVETHAQYDDRDL
jgi:mRNA interferase HigB